MKEGGLGTIGVVQVAEKKYQEEEGESAQHTYV